MDTHDWSGRSFRIKCADGHVVQTELRMLMVRYQGHDDELTVDEHGAWHWRGQLVSLLDAARS
ncbi:hypothetical protein ACFVX3_31355 [Rhodococcus erythropolis]